MEDVPYARSSIGFLPPAARGPAYELVRRRRDERPPEQPAEAEDAEGEELGTEEAEGEEDSE